MGDKQINRQTNRLLYPRFKKMIIMITIKSLPAGSIMYQNHWPSKDIFQPTFPATQQIYKQVPFTPYQSIASTSVKMKVQRRGNCPLSSDYALGRAPVAPFAVVPRLIGGVFISLWTWMHVSFFKMFCVLSFVKWCKDRLPVVFIYLFFYLGNASTR